MGLRFIDHPRPVDRERYTELIDRTVARIASWPGVESVYQIGGISDPGISDIDMVVVFRDGVSYVDDPRRELEPAERYLLSHGLYGVHASHFGAAQAYSCFYNYRHLHGKPQSIRPQGNAAHHAAVIRRQIAMEYLLRMYMSLAVQITYCVVKLRSLLLTAKAVQYDLDFLGITDDRLHGLIGQLVRWRATWFDRFPAQEEMAAWILSFFAGIEELLRDSLEDVGFHYVLAERYRAARHLYLINRRPLSYAHFGVVMPSCTGTLYPRGWLGIHNRLNRFHFAVPVRDVQENRVLAERMAFEDKLMSDGQRHLPHFLPLRSALTLQVAG